MANVNTREIALDTLVEILEHGQFSHIYLKQVLDKYGYLEKNERSFITRLVNGTVERLIELDYIIDSYSKTKTKKMKPLIRTLLRMGCFEIYYMDSVPDSATCNEYVKLAKKRGFKGLSGFVNGILRSIIRGKANLKIDDISIRYSMPQWIIDKWEKDYGLDETVKICQGFFENEKLCIRVNTDKISVDDFAKALEKDGIKAESIAEIPTALYIIGYDSVAAIKGFDEGLFYVQDYSSQLVATVAGIKEADQILDLCAAPGGKALHAASLASKGQVLARDLTEKKVAIIEENIKRFGQENIKAEVFDATVFDESSVGKFDLVIADLPCSGLGIIRKKPDIKYNQTIDSLTELTTLQEEILANACQYVKDGGKLCYSTCTINVDENEKQVEKFINSHPEFTVEYMKQLFPDAMHDGFFICVMRKKI